MSTRKRKSDAVSGLSARGSTPKRKQTPGKRSAAVAEPTDAPVGRAQTAPQGVHDRSPTEISAAVSDSSDRSAALIQRGLLRAGMTPRRASRLADSSRSWRAGTRAAPPLVPSETESTRPCFPRSIGLSRQRGASPFDAEVLKSESTEKVTRDEETDPPRGTRRRFRTILIASALAAVTIAVGSKARSSAHLPRSMASLTELAVWDLAAHSLGRPALAPAPEPRGVRAQLRGLLDGLRRALPALGRGAGRGGKDRRGWDSEGAAAGRRRRQLSAAVSTPARSGEQGAPRRAKRRQEKGGGGFGWDEAPGALAMQQEEWEEGVRAEEMRRWVRTIFQRAGALFFRPGAALMLRAPAGQLAVLPRKSKWELRYKLG
jgi:hypothetical protein